MTKLMAVLERRWPVLVALTVLGAVAGAISALVASDEVEERYAVSEVVVANPTTQGRAVPLVAQDALRVTRGEVLQRAAEELGRAEARAELQRTITAEVDEDSDSITVTAEDPDPDRATVRVRAVVDAFLEVTQEDSQAAEQRQLEETRSQLTQAEDELARFDEIYPELTSPGAVPNDPAGQALVEQRRTLVTRVADLESDLRNRQRELDRAAPYASLGVEPAARVTDGLVSIPASVPLRAALLALLGFLFAAVVVLLVERLNRRIDTREELEEAIGSPVIAEVGLVAAELANPPPGRPVSLEGAWSEPYRRVRAAMQFATSGVSAEAPRGVTAGAARAPQGPTPPPYRGPADLGPADPAPAPRGAVFLVTSASPAEGKSTSAALIGRACAEAGTPTLVVGGDYRRPEVHRLLAVPPDPSLANLVNGTASAVDEVVHATAEPGLWVAPSGPPTKDVAALTEVTRMVCAETRQRGGTVVVDSSPLRAASDSLDLLSVVDHVILVVRSGRTTESALRDSVEALRRLDADLLGAIFVGAPGRGREQEYYDAYYAPTNGSVPQVPSRGRRLRRRRR